MILNTNSYFGQVGFNGQAQWNAEANGVEDSEQNCVPIFYVLDDVQIHCDSEGLIFTDGTYAANLDSQYPGTINFFVSHIALSAHPSATGFAVGGTSFIAIERTDVGLIGHEIGHVLDLDHTYSGDGGTLETRCDDIWDTAWEWDIDGDGIVDESGDRCWSFVGNTYNGLDACNGDNFTITHPCCEWTAQNNNLMGGTAFSNNPDFAAITPCQIDIMLSQINSALCDEISDIGCSSAKANIGVLPNDGTTEGDCEFCIILEHSFFESEYDVTIELLVSSPSIWVPVFNSGFQDGAAKNICISLANTPLSNDANSFRPGETYRVTLDVKNGCSQDSESLVIDIPGPRKECNDYPVKKVTASVSPNPTTGHINIDYNLEIEGRLESYIIDPLNPGNNIGIINENMIEGKHTISTEIPHNARNGVYYLIYKIDNDTYFETIIKQ